MNYKRLNDLTGWAVWLIASVVYLLTIEPTASFWDCGEFIASAYKLEVGHPPGAPMFMLLARLFSMFFPAAMAATAVNVMSAMASSFTILFLFWSITHMARKLAVSRLVEGATSCLRRSASPFWRVVQWGHWPTRSVTASGFLR